MKQREQIKNIEMSKVKQEKWKAAFWKTLSARGCPQVSKLDTKSE